MDAPNNEIWFFSGELGYKEIKYEYFTEYDIVSFEVSIFNARMQRVGTIKDSFVLKEDEARVRQVSVLPVITKNFFNDDDNYEVAISVIVNPKPWGTRPYTYVYSLGGEKNAEGDDEPVMVFNDLISDVCDASTDTQENFVITFLSEGNDSGVSSDDLTDDNFWQYQMGYYVRVQSYGKVDAEGNLTKVFDKKIIYLQTQGNQQDDSPLMTYVHNGKPTLIFPRYDEVFFNEYGMTTDMTQRFPNNLFVEIYELDNLQNGFQLVQTSHIPMEKQDDEQVIASYYSIGTFSYTNDVIYGADGKATFIVTRRDLLGTGDTERQSYYLHNADGALIKPLFENAASHTRLSDIPGFDPMELVITNASTGYVFNFTNMNTLETELSINYGLTVEDSDEPDYMMANVDRVKVGDTYKYVAEMRMPEYDDINDVNFMRIAWLDRQGNVTDMDRVNMGNLVNYATVFINAITLHEDYFFTGPEHEYMILIKRAFSSDSSRAEEQLLVSQAASDAYPSGRELMLLGTHETYGALSTIIPYEKPNRLSVTYVNSGSNSNYTTVYYSLPLDKPAGVDLVGATQQGNQTFTFDGTTVSAQGAIEVYNL